MKGVFIALLFAVCISVTFALNLALGGVFFFYLIAYYLLMFLIGFVVSYRFIGLKKAVSVLVVCCSICGSVLGVRTFLNVRVLEGHEFEGTTLMELDQFLWRSTHGRIMLQYTPMLRDMPVDHDGSIGGYDMNLAQFKNQIKDMISGSEVLIKQTSNRPGYYDFGFKSRGYHFWIDYKVLPSELKAVERKPEGIIP